MNRPQSDEFGAFYKRYVDSISDDVLAELKEQETALPALLRAHPEKADFAYGEGMWTLKELLGHLIDTERIMAYRLLRISRNDSTPLPGFDQDTFVQFAEHSKADFEKLIQEFEVVRKSTLFLIDSLSEEQLNYRGNANGNPLSGRALAYIIAGHLKHHIVVIKEKYL